MDDIVAKKKELLNQIKSNKYVRGAGIKGVGSKEYIVVYVSSINTAVKNLVPTSFKGVKVKTEKEKQIKFM